MRTSRILVAAGLLLLVGASGASAGFEVAPRVALCSIWPLTQPPGDLIGTPGDDVMLGTAGDDVMYGYGGHDIICGGAGNDAIYGGLGMDHLLGESGHDKLFGQGGCDWLEGGDGNDVLYPGDGGVSCSGTAEGGGGRDRIVIDGEGDNDVFGGPQRDTIDFRRAPVGMIVNLRRGHFDSATLPPIGSFVWETEVVFGSAFRDWIYGTNRPNRLFGNGGNDILKGFGGDDILDGGPGTDVLDGGDDADFCTTGETLIGCEGP